MAKRSNNNKSLVIVESPAKARTISRILGSNTTSRLPSATFATCPSEISVSRSKNGFLPKYVVPKEKAKTVKEIRDAAQKAERDLPRDRP